MTFGSSPPPKSLKRKTILGTAATDDAFYVLTTADISDEQGTFSLYGDEIYRSTNGTDWTATDQSDADSHGYRRCRPQPAASDNAELDGVERQRF